jgi:hypothetical protein
MRGVSNPVPVLLPLVFLAEVVAASLLATVEVAKLRNSYSLEKQVLKMLGLEAEKKVPRVSSRMTLEVPKVRRKTSVEKNCSAVAYCHI